MSDLEFGQICAKIDNLPIDNNFAAKVKDLFFTIFYADNIHFSYEEETGKVHAEIEDISGDYFELVIGQEPEISGWFDPLAPYNT